jgi:hypothetical protein
MLLKTNEAHFHWKSAIEPNRKGAEASASELRNPTVLLLCIKCRDYYTSINIYTEYFVVIYRTAGLPPYYI